MQLKKVLEFLKLTGNTPLDTFWIFVAKVLFLPKRVLTKNVNLGHFLFRDVIAKTNYGLFFCRKKREDLGFISESFESKILNFFKPIKGEIVVDVGAHIGKYTILASKLVEKKGKVIALEPEPENFKILTKNCELNNCKNVILLNYAVWDSTKDLKLFLTEATTEHSLKKKTEKFIKVKTISLDRLFEKMKLKKVDWLKIDVEGAEIEAIRGALKSLEKKLIYKIILEAGPSNFKKLQTIFKKNGYSIKRILPNYWFITF